MERLSSKPLQLLILYTSLAWLCTSCQTFGNLGNIQISSEPTQGAVYVFSEDGKKTKLGETPVTLRAEELGKIKGPLARFIVEKEGFESVTFLSEVRVPLRSTKFNFELNALNETLSEENVRDKAGEKISMVAGNEIATNIAKSQVFLSQKKYQEAKKTLEYIADEYPYISVTYDLLGNLYYINKDIKNAKRNYEKSLELYPDNIQTKNMLSKLKALSN